MECDGCGLHYDDMRTGLTYRDVYHMIFDRPYKRRHGVLGAWFEIKQGMWNDHLRECESEVR